MCPGETASSRAWFCKGSCCGPVPSELFSREAVSLVSNGTPIVHLELPTLLSCGPDQ